MKAIILAAGQGKRLRPLTYAIPKSLLPVGGKPVIDYVLDNVCACPGIDEIFVAVSHKASVIEDYLEHSERGGPRISVVKTLGWETGGDVKTVLVEKQVEGPALVCYGDNVTRLDVGALCDAHGDGAHATVALFPVPRQDVPRFGIAEMDGGRIARFVEKPAAGSTESNLANAGYFVLDPQALKNHPMGKFRLEEECFPKWAQEGKLMGQIQKLKIWIDIGTIESYKAANRMADDILPPPPGRE